jgi:hypothetical protein
VSPCSWANEVEDVHNLLNASMDVFEPESGLNASRERNKLARISRTLHDDSADEDD